MFTKNNNIHQYKQHKQHKQHECILELFNNLVC